jgi:predicted nucleotidyltransferase
MSWEKALEKVLGLLKEEPKVERVLLFGSRARGDFKKGSDIDLLKFESLSDPFFKETILREGKELYFKNREGSRRFQAKD